MQTANQMVKNDPRNQPISQVTAFANLIVNGTNEIRTPEMVKWPNGPVALLTLNKAGDSKTSSSSPFGLLVADDGTLGGNANFPNARMYFMQFQPDLFSVASNIGRNKGTAGEIDDVKFVGLGVNFLPSGSEILGGAVEIRVVPLLKCSKFCRRKTPIMKMASLHDRTGYLPQTRPQPQ